MKKFMTFAALFCLVCVIGCAGGGPKAGDWINNPPPFADAIAAVGAAPYTQLVNIMRREAEQDGRVAVARVLGTRVQELIKNWAQQNQSSLHDEAAFNTYFESVSRAITNEDLTGARIDKWYYDEATKTQYALAVHKLEDAARLAKAKLEDKRKQMEKEEQEERLFTSREEAKRAFGELDALIEKQLGGK